MLKIIKKYWKAKPDFEYLSSVQIGHNCPKKFVNKVV